MLTAAKIVELFDMKPLLPEGGFIKVFNFSDIILDKDALPERYQESRPICGTILYLITPESYSRMHFLPTDEVYHFYIGDSVEQLQLLEDGTGRIVRMGQNIEHDESIQSIAPANCWHGTRLVEEGKFALLGTTMAPAYTDDDYIDGAEFLMEQYPDFKDEILKRL